MLVAGLMVGLSVLGVQPPALAEGNGEVPPAPAISTDPSALPFSDTELQRALLARLLPSPDETGPAAARVAPAGPGAVSVRVGDQSRVVVVGDRKGIAAARVVALVIAELMMSPGPAPSIDAAEPPEAAPAPSAVARAGLEPVGAARGHVWRATVAGGLSKGTGSEELAAAALDADLVIPLGDGGWKLSPSLGLRFMPTRNADTFHEVSFVSAVARLLCGGARGPIGLFAGPFVSAYAIGGATAHSGFLFGAEAMARVAAPLSRSMRLAVETRLDGYVNRLQADWLAGGGYATPRVGVGIGIGLAWDWTS